jgi:type IV secretion system protein VirD4
VLLAMAALIAFLNIDNIGTLHTVFVAMRESDDAKTMFRTYLFDGYDNVSSSAFFEVWLALWTIPALITLAVLVSRPSKWDSFANFTWFLLSALAVVGYPLAHLIYFFAGLMIPNISLVVFRAVLPPLLLPFAGLITLGGLSGTITLLTKGFVYLLVVLPLEVVDYISNNLVNTHIRRQKRATLTGYLGNFRLWLTGDAGATFPPDERRGARLATDAEIQLINRPDAPESMVFGHTETGPLFLKTDKHVLIMASTRSGKGVTLIIPHLLCYTGSAFVLDPKGENARASGRERARINDTVHYLDPFGISGKPLSRFNPLSRFTLANMETQSKAVAASIFVVGERERDHWTASGQQLLAAIILYVFLSPNLPKDKKDLPNVRRILLGGLDIAFNEMAQMTDADGLLSALATSFRQTPERELGSIISTVQRQTEILDNPAMIACLSASGAGPEVDFKEWRRGTMTVYLCLSAPKFSIFNRWLRLVLTSALDEMTDTLNPPPLPVCFMLDELATLGHLPAVENAVGLAAGYGIQLVTVFQDVAQMRDLYKGRWASFIGNAGVRALFNLDDFETAEYWSKFIGSRVTETHGRQEDRFGLSEGQSVGETMRPLFPPDLLMMKFASGQMLVLAQGQRPIITDRVAYFNDASLAGLWDDPRVPGPAPANKK